MLQSNVTTTGMAATSHMLQSQDLCIVLTSFAVYWIVDLAARAIWPHLLPAELFKDPKAKIMLGRHTMDIVAMILFMYLAVCAERDQDFQALPKLTPMERIYHRNPICE